MSDRQEQLSALLDDFRGRDEDLAALSELQSDVNQQYTLQRYGMIGDVMRNELPDRLQTDFSARVRAAVAGEDSLVVDGVPGGAQAEPRRPWFSSLFKPLAGLAVAASVAVVAVTLVQVQKPAGQEQAQLAAATDARTQARVEQLARTQVSNNVLQVSGKPSQPRLDSLAGTQWKIKRGKPDVQSRLNAYLINHNEHSTSMNGIIPQARVVGFDAQR